MWLLGNLLWVGEKHPGASLDLGSQAWGRMWLPGAAFPILYSHLGSPTAPRAGAFPLLVQLQRGIRS